MNRSIVALLLVALMILPSTVHSQTINETPAWRALVSALEPAATISVRLKNGKRIVGTLVDHSQDDLIVKPRTRIPVPAQRIAFADVEAIERKHLGWSPGAKALAGAGIVVGGLYLAALVALAVYGD